MKNFKTYSNNIEKKSSKAIIIFRIISVLIIAFCSYRLFTWYQENQANHNLISNLRSQIEFPESVVIDSTQNPETENPEKQEGQENQEISQNNIDFSNLINLNSDTVAWVNVKNTDIDFPVVKTDNNDYYINHNFEKKYNSAGWIFADYRNNFDGNDKNIIIYGHNRRDGSMFSSLNNVLEESWYTNPDNQIIALYTPSNILNYKVFSVYKIKESNFNNSTNFENDSEFQKYLDTAINSSIYNFNETLTSSDKILTLYTCANNNKYRIIVHAKQIN